MLRLPSSSTRLCCDLQAAQTPGDLRRGNLVMPSENRHLSKLCTEKLQGLPQSVGIFLSRSCLLVPSSHVEYVPSIPKPRPSLVLFDSAFWPCSPRFSTSKP